jgi:hypothetical protein
MSDSLGGENREASSTQVAFGPFKCFGFIRSDQHAGQAITALVERAAIPVPGEFCKDRTGAGNVFERPNLQVTSQWCRFGLCGLRGRRRGLWALEVASGTA